MPMASPDLDGAYRDLVETERGPDGVRYAGALPDGTTVDVVAIAPELGAKVRDDQRFFDTLGRASRVEHPALASPIAWGRTPGGTLHAAFHRSGAARVPTGLSSAEVALLGVELVGALDLVHATGLTHGAITPRHVRRAEGAVMLAEFGLLPALVAGGVDVQSAVMVSAEPPYVCPEVRGGSVPDDRGDVFALGAVLYELLTGKPPFGGRTTAYVLASVLADETAGETPGADESSNPVVDALLRAIEHQPDDRWPSARAFAQALSAAGAPAPRGSVTRARRGCLPAVAAVVAALTWEASRWLS